MKTDWLVVGEFGSNDSSIQVSGLTPGHFYTLRVTATNAANFSTIGSIIRFQTLSSVTGATGGTSSASCPYPEDEKQTSRVAAVRPAPSRSEPSIAHPMHREPSGGQSKGKKGSADRQISAATGSTAPDVESTSKGSGQVEAVPRESIEDLRVQLDQLRQEQRDLEQQMQSDEQECQTHIRHMAAEKSRLEMVLREKEEASTKLKRQGNALDKANRTAQNRRAAKEKLLSQKKADRQKLHDDIAKWNEEIAEMERNTLAMQEETESIGKNGRQVVDGIKQSAEDDQNAIRVLEEEIRSKGIEVKELEDQRAKAFGETDEDKEAAGIAKARRDDWEARVYENRSQIQSMQQQVRQLEAEERAAQETLNWHLMRRNTSPQLYGPSGTMEYNVSSHAAQQRRHRGSLSRGSTISNPSVGNATSHGVPPSQTSFPGTSPWPFVGGGMGVPVDSGTASNNATTPGAMSPAASTLLPSDLLQDEDQYDCGRGPGRQESHGSQGSDSLGRRTADLGIDTGRAPLTPASTNSRGGSMLGSPRDSISNLPRYGTPGSFPHDSDRNSINSANTPYQQVMHGESSPLAASRFSNLFNSGRFGKQRGKSASDEPPMLGTLKQGESQSFPREVTSDLMGSLDQPPSGRRRGSHGNWTNSLLGRGSLNQGEQTRPRLGIFGPRVDSTENHDPSSRPSSLYSLETGLNRPSSDSRRFPFFGHDNPGNRTSALGHAWGSGGIWSSGQSRRSSAQHGSTSNLSLGSTPLDPQSEESRNATSGQAPIGTRPKPSKNTPGNRAGSAAAKLNPAAPAFRTIFNKKLKLDKGSEPTNPSESTKSITSHSEAEETDPTTMSDFSPKGRRSSRDTQSVIDSTTSQADSRSSMDHSTSGTPSEALTPSAPKESLMQRITRKGSSSKFNIPWNKDSRSGSFFSSKKVNGTNGTGDPVTPSEDDLESQEGTDSVTGTPQLDKLPEKELAKEKGSKGRGSWPGLRKKSKKSTQSIFSGTEAEEIEV